MSTLTTSTLQLPVETWSHIIQYLHFPHQIPLLHVSRAFHDIAVRFLFSTVKIYFLGAEAARFMASPNGPPLPVDEIIERMMHRSWDLLQYIQNNPQFASVVKNIAVFAFADHVSIFEKLCLQQALCAIPQLQCFHWFGAYPQFSETLAECLPPSLQSLHLESIPSPAALDQLCMIDHLQLAIPFYYSRDIFDNPEDGHWDPQPPAFEDAATIIESMSTTLRTLSLIAQNVSDIPIRVYSSLIELEICVTFYSTLLGVDLIFHHAPLLESLTLVGYITSDIFSILSVNSAALSRLKSFRLSCESTSLPLVTAEEVFVLSTFLEKRAALRRLCIRLVMAEWDSISTLLATIKDLPDLEVLGLHTGYKCLKPEDVDVLSTVFSPKLRAIYLVISWDHPDLANLDINILWPLLHELGTLPRLSFLHLYGIGRYLPIIPEDLTAEIRGLETVGLNRVLWDVDWSGSEVTLTEWPPWKAKFAIEEDFQSPDDAWLFRYH